MILQQRTRAMTRNSSNSIWLLTVVSILFLVLAACGKKGPAGAVAPPPFPPPFDQPNPFDPRLQQDIEQALPDLNSPNAGKNLGGGDITLGDEGPLDVGSGPSGGVNQADRQSLKLLMDEMAGVNPLEDEVDFPPDLERQLKAVIQRRPTNQQEIDQAQIQKLQLAGKMLGHCAEKIADYAPRPGEPLLGSWSGSCRRTKYHSGQVRFEVSGSASGVEPNSGGGGSSVSTVNNRSNPGANGALPVGDLTYRVNGDPNIEGTMAAGPDGVAQLQLKNAAKIHKKSQHQSLQGFLTDVPQAGTGRITFPGTSKRGIGGRKGCVANVHLDSSRSLIPEKFQEGMKKAGQCFRKALFLMSPLADRMFRNMDPALAQLLQQRMLGFSSQQ